MNKLIGLTSAELIALGTEEARAEALRRHEKRLARDKRPIPAICEFLGLPMPEKVAKKAAPAPAPASAPASAPVTPEDDGLMTLEFAKLRALGRELEVKGKSRLTLVERIRAARLAKAKPAAPVASASPDAAAIAAIATKAALAAVDAWVKANS
jgi:hypothetical protein